MADSNDSPATPSSDSGPGSDSPPAAPIVPKSERLVYDEYVDLQRGPELPVAIAEALAEIGGTPPGVLSDVVDTDGLERVFRHEPDTAHRTGWVTFFFGGYRLVFDSTHRLRIYDRP